MDEVNGYDIVYKWYDYLKEQGNYLHGYVIMPNHVHSIISFVENDQNINTTVGNGKRFMAYEIIKRLEQSKNASILSALIS